jgi:hypothetical protein
MESGSIYTVLSILLVLSGIATAFTASSKGRDAMGWFIVGFCKRHINHTTGQDNCR